MTNPNGGFSPTAPTPPNPNSFSVDLQTGPTPQFDPSPDNLFVNINPLHPPDARTLVYAPDVEIFIARDNKQYDVSRDIVSVAVQRNENAISTLVFKLANKIDPATGKPRYNQLFERMDRVICRMKRVEWKLVFSGYLDSVPHVQLYPGTVNFKASCTIKRILHTYWDPGLSTSAALMDQAGIQSKQEAAGNYSTDTGLGVLLRRFLVEVGGWHPSNIQIQRFPETYYTFMNDQLKKTAGIDEHNEQEFRRLLLGDDLTLGTYGPSTGNEPGVQEGSFTTATLTQPERMLEVIKTVDAMGMGPSAIDISAAQGLSGAASRAAAKDDPTSIAGGAYQPAWKAEQEVGTNWEEAGKKTDAAIHCFMCIAVESPGWIMYANNAVPESLQYPHDALSTDHTSVGLYQQTEGNGWGSVRQRMNVRASTEMFLKKLQGLNWQNMDRGTAVQAVQRSAFPAKYALHEQDAISQVRQLRQNQTPGSGPSAGTGNVGTNIPGLGAIPGASSLPVPPGAASAAVNKIATSADASSPQSAAAATGVRPRYDTAGAIGYARAQLNKPYEWAATGPGSFDCSGLTMMAYRSIGLEIGRNTHDQLARGQSIPASQAKPGDLIFPNGVEHVVMVSDVPGMVIEAQQTGVPIHEVPMAAAGITPNMPCCHIPGTTYGGPGAAYFDPFPTKLGEPAGTVAQGVDGTAAATGHSEPIARNLFTYMFVTTPGSWISNMFGVAGEEEKAFMNDQSMLPTVVTMCQARLCKFNSAPNGDFQAYYPDYFGMDGKRAVLKLEDIEMKNVQIDLNDDSLVTHAYVAGSQMPQQSSFGILGWILSKGYATVENRWLFNKMQLAAPMVPGQKMTDGKAIMRQFGARPLTKDMPMLQHGPMEFLASVQLFMESWAEQYATQVELTFMPELWVGNRIELVSAGLQVYVSSVSHSCDWESGFSTTATIMAPSTPMLGRMISQITNPKSTNNTNDTDQATGAAKWLF